MCICPKPGELILVNEMKLCIPSADDRGIDAPVASHFGSAPFFTMIDLEGDAVTVVRNPACGHAPGECHHLDILRAHGVGTVACSGIGRRAFDALARDGVRVLTASLPTVRDLVAAVRSGQAAPMTIQQTCAGHHGEHRHRHRHRHRHGRGPIAST